MKKATSILFFLFLSLLALAQKSQPAELHFNRLFVKDGLPQGRITSLLQDKEGYIWLGTQKGLVRYDGYSPKLYNFGIADPYKRYIGIIYLDREGRLWVGGGENNDVLYLYDRTEDRFISFKPNSSITDTSSLSIDNMRQDQNGHLWLSMYDRIKKKGVLERFDPATKKFTRYGYDEKGAHNINAQFFTNFCPDDKHGICVGSNNGIYQFNERTEHFDHFLAPANPARQHRFQLAGHSTEPGILWLGAESGPLRTGHGLWRYNISTKTVTVFRHNPNDSSSISGDRILWQNVDSLHHLWVSTENGLSLFVPEKNNFINYYLKDSSSQFLIHPWEIKSDKNNNLWLTTGHGLVFFNTKTGVFTRYLAHEKDPYGLAADDEIHDLLIDRSGTLWFGVNQIGLQWINKPLSRFIQYKDDPGQPHHFPGGVVNCFAESKDSTLWLASAHGLYHWKPQADSFTLIKISQAHGKDFYVSCVMADNFGRVWFGSNDLNTAGLYCFNPKNGQTSYFSNNKKDITSLSDNNVSALLQDHLGNIWIGTTYGGICRYVESSKNFVRYPFMENTGFLPTNNGVLDDAGVTKIYEDKNNNLWVGTNYGGLNRFNRQAGTFISYNGLLPGFSRVISIQEDAKNRLWVGTYFGGVFSFDPKTGLAKNYNEKDGLLYDGAGGVVEDDKGNLWLTTLRGISIFNPQTKQVRNLTTANGLPSENLITAFKTSNGQFLFSGSDGGFISFKPDNFNPDVAPPVVHIESVSFANSNAGKTKDSTLVTYGKNSISLHYNENRLSFHYVGLYYQNPQLNQYAYKLDGYDNDWIPAGTQRMVTYTNLSPGNYTFHVKAANSDGVWNEQGASFAFTILPPWWQKWWAYTAYIILFAGAIFFITRYQQQRLFQKEQHRNKLLELEMQALRAQMNPHFIFNCLSSINRFVLMNETEAASDYLTKFSKLIRTVLNNSKKSLIALEDEIEMLKLYLDMEKLRFQDGFEYNVSVNNDVEVQNIFIPPLLFQPFAENAVWHGLMHKKEKGLLRIRLSVKDKILSFEIEDNGIGRGAADAVKSKSAEKNKSLGLQITKDRLALINGYTNEKTFFEIEDLHDENGNASGTKVILKIKYSETTGV